MRALVLFAFLVAVVTGSTTIVNATTLMPNTTTMAPTPTSGPGNTNTVIAITLGIVGGFLLIAILIGCCIGCRRPQYVPGSLVGAVDFAEDEDIEGQMPVGTTRMVRQFAYDKMK